MQKIKYILIFTLTLALGLLYYKTDNYQKLSNILLSKNNQMTQEHRDLEEKIENLKDQMLYRDGKILTLNEKIIKLEEKLLLSQMKMADVNYTIQTTEDITHIIPPNLNNSIDDDDNTTTNDINITPNITIDDENSITGFGLQYGQKF